jgi:hypothetical protein
MFGLLANFPDVLANFLADVDYTPFCRYRPETDSIFLPVLANLKSLFWTETGSMLAVLKGLNFSADLKVAVGEPFGSQPREFGPLLEGLSAASLELFQLLVKDGDSLISHLGIEVLAAPSISESIIDLWRSTPIWTSPAILRVELPLVDSSSMELDQVLFLNGSKYSLKAALVEDGVFLRPDDSPGFLVYRQGVCEAADFISGHLIMLFYERVPAMTADQFRQFSVGFFPAPSSVSRLLHSPAIDWSKFVFRPDFAATLVRKFRVSKIVSLMQDNAAFANELFPADEDLVQVLQDPEFLSSCESDLLTVATRHSNPPHVFLALVDEADKVPDFLLKLGTRREVLARNRGEVLRIVCERDSLFRSRLFATFLASVLGDPDDEDYSTIVETVFSQFSDDVLLEALRCQSAKVDHVLRAVSRLGGCPGFVEILRRFSGDHGLRNDPSWIVHLISSGAEEASSLLVKVWPASGEVDPFIAEFLRVHHRIEAFAAIIGDYGHWFSDATLTGEIVRDLWSCRPSSCRYFARLSRSLRNLPPVPPEQFAGLVTEAFDHHVRQFDKNDKGQWCLSVWRVASRIPGAFAHFERPRADQMLIVPLFEADIPVSEIKSISSDVLESINNENLSESISIISLLATVPALLVPYLPHICGFACWTESALWHKLLSMVPSVFDLRFQEKFALGEIESIPGDLFTSINLILERVGEQSVVLPSLSDWFCSRGAQFIDRLSGGNRSSYFLFLKHCARVDKRFRGLVASRFLERPTAKYFDDPDVEARAVYAQFFCDFWGLQSGQQLESHRWASLVFEQFTIMVGTPGFTMAMLWPFVDLFILFFKSDSTHHMLSLTTDALGCPEFIFIANVTDADPAGQTKIRQLLINLSMGGMQLNLDRFSAFLNGVRDGDLLKMDLLAVMMTRWKAAFAPYVDCLRSRFERTQHTETRAKRIMGELQKWKK